jgi:subtilisin-like proprotein convertase family protein
LIQRRGGSGDNLQLVIDDQASTSVSTIAAASTITGTYRGEQSLSAFRGRSAKGQWRLQITDHARGDIGFLRSAQLQIVPTASASRASVDTNRALSLSSGVDFSQWHTALQRERESAPPSTIRTNLNHIIERIFAEWF